MNILKMLFLGMIAISALADDNQSVKFQYECTPYLKNAMGFKLNTGYLGTYKPDSGSGIFNIAITGDGYTAQIQSNQYFAGSIEFSGLSDVAEKYGIQNGTIRMGHDLFLGGVRSTGSYGKDPVESYGGMLEIYGVNTISPIRFWCERPLE